MKDCKILHIANDEKFINAAHYLFDKAFPGLNEFVIVKPPANPPTRYISSEIDARFVIKSPEAVNELALLSNNFAVTVLHGFDQLKGLVYLKSGNRHRFMTIVYGAEIYNRPEIIGKEVTGKKTKKLYDLTQRKTVVDFMKDIYRNLAYKDFPELEEVNISEILFEMDVFGSFPSISYDRYIENNIYKPTVTKVPFSYYPIEYIIKNEDLRAKGRDILFGNSAGPTNNHIEGFDLLKKLDLDGRTIVTPLSYGPQKYARAIAKQGQHLFPNNFKALVSFLPIEEYNKIISQCGIVVMNHYRPQAMGNIIASLYMGAKVFVNNTDAYKYLKQLGCIIYLIEEDLLAQHQKDAFRLLTDEQVEHNRMVLRNELSTSVLVKKMRSAFEDIYDFTSNSLEAV